VSAVSSEPDEASASASLWRLAEIYHALVYYAPERAKHYEKLGLKGGWMAYFATRSGALGEVPPAVVTACFYNFKPTMVERALPDAWRYTTPEQACAARLAVFDEAVRRLLGDKVDSVAVTEAAELACEAVRGLPVHGRPLFAAHVSLPLPTAPHEVLFWATAAMREYRGDGHTMALATAGVDGCEAHVLMAGMGLVPPDQRLFRGWSEEDWEGAATRLRERGWLDRDAQVTDRGHRERGRIEQMTDRLSHPLLDCLGADRARLLADLLTPLAAGIVTAGGVPYPNGMGAPPAPELSTMPSTPS
jgi:hypothetical protein